MTNWAFTKGRNASKTWLMRGLMIACMVSGTSAMAEMLRYTDHDPVAAMRPQFINDVWIPEIEKQSDGDLTVKPFYGGVLMGSKEVLTGVGQGIVDMGFFYPGHYPERLVAHTIFPLFPRGPKSFEDISWFYHQVYDNVPAFREELEAEGVIPLMATIGLPGAFAATYPIASMDDLKGYKWRAGGKWPLKYLENVGATPVSVPWGDTFVALQTGTIDGVYTNYDGMHGMKFDEAAPNLLISKELWFPVPQMQFMNKEKFDSLSEENQQAIRDASSKAEQAFNDVYDAAFGKIRKAQEEAGATVTEMSEEDVSTWENKDMLPALQQEWVEGAKSSGLENAAEVMEQVRAIHAEAMAR